MFFQQNFLKKPYRVHGLLFLLLITAGVVYAGPEGAARGLWAIFSGPDGLVRDYIYIGGFGGALVNVGLAGLLAVFALVLARHEPAGLTMGTFGLVIGFAFFGKNVLNMLPIIAGGFLYGKVAGVAFDKCVLRAVLATCLAPAVTQLIFVSGLPLAADIAIGVAVGLGIGFLINPLAAHMEAAHKGLNLYNVGWTAGIVGMGIFVMYRLLGADSAVLEVWSEGYSLHLAILLAAVSVYFILCGALADVSADALKKVGFSDFFKFHKYELDFFANFREKAYINMGIMGLACLAFMAAVRGEYNGPVIGAILSVVGFGAFGKALGSAAPIVAGAMLAAVAGGAVTGTPFNDRGFLVAAIFSTCLSPLCKKFGPWWGVAAGFLHLAFAVNIAGFHGGLNLYNNGFAGGLAAMIILPIANIKFLK